MVASAAEIQWSRTMAGNGIVHYERWIHVSKTLRVRERKVEMEIECHFDDAVFFLLNPETAEQWMQGVKKVKVLCGGECPSQPAIAQTVFNLPWPFKDQDMVARYSLESCNESSCRIVISSVPDAAPRKSNTVRIRDYTAIWELSRSDNGTVRIVFTVCSREAPRFPRLIQDPLIKKMFRENFDTLKERLGAR